MFHKRSSLLFLVISLQVCSFEAISIANAEPDSFIEFVGMNSPKGYTTTVSIDDGGMVRLDSIRTTGGKGNSFKTLKLSQKQSDRLQTLLRKIDPPSLEAEYGLGLLGADAASYLFRFRNGDAWKETRIDPHRTAPKAPDPLLALKKFMIALIYPK
jgi:hypothetical protein